MFKITVVHLLISLMVTAVCIVQNVQATDKCTDAASCSSHGTCEGADSSKACSCTGGYSGDKCDKAPICKSGGNECLHGGTCDVTKPQYVCSCTGGYKGDKCQNCAVVVRISAYCVIFGLASYWITTWAHIV